jgi:hypothetical protein
MPASAGAGCSSWGTASLNDAPFPKPGRLGCYTALLQGLHDDVGQVKTKQVEQQEEIRGLKVMVGGVRPVHGRVHSAGLPAADMQPATP